LPLLLILCATTAPAQQQTDQSDADKPARQPSTPAPSDTDQPATRGSGAVSNDDQSAFEYESSEQISEDLSVSFPVDI
jgi:hypothetical protein